MADKDPKSNGEPQAGLWLRRQWLHLRTMRVRDIIIGQVGERATNVIIGKNNVQIVTTQA
ncbi:MAG: hypothetical protein R3C14_04740 [Caldilineaceae bacterium]